MKLNILIGGSAGQGMDTVSVFLEKALKKGGFYVFSNKDYMSRVRGGHNFTQIRFGDEPIYSHDAKLDLILALDRDTVEIHKDKLNENGIIIADEAIQYDDKRLVRLPLLKTAKDVGLSKAFTFVAAGAILKHFGIKGNFEDFIAKKLAEPIRNKNIEAFKKGRDLVDERFTITGKVLSNHLIINGNDAIGLGALIGGLSFYSAYPMTPATSVMTYLSKKSLEAGIVVEQAEDEISAINMAIGASYAGARAMTGSSGGGVALMVEAFGLAGITETPLVVIDSQRPGPATGLPTRTEQSDLSFLLTASQGEFPRVVLSVRNAEDAFYQTFRALNIADKYQTLVILLTDQYLADSNITIPRFALEDLKIERHISDGTGLDEEYRRYKITESGISPRLIPGKVKGQVVLVDSDEHTEYSHITEEADIRNAQMEKRMRKLDLLIKEDLQEPDYFGGEDIDVLLVSWGSTFGAVKEAAEALNDTGIKVGALSFGDIYPLPEKLLKKYSNKAKKVINVEQNFTGQLGKLITQETGILMDDSILKYDGRQITSDEIVSRLSGEV
ncbi:2-oxoacid:acceptor oxidoreductase subunit alpha [Clostridium folliculivorans]|uniref:2-oxoacid:ferredoxin oxidoreductase subunit alpha n=1 Tax=Clostridium folliculivorans TaxID=2886038 RepID=A0A9W6D930_9CLOT|nr:2-oxoacid:acceptor oxidoreductase subunit alpha [Clostridium folliculivorans]GKU23342.1 2-oxoacid:ferredoxin oxidoreductase subunit alpha [Clostridium folliculivorans]GKU29459.1 2-oxoacid:ferredoxin oxidoreductase subunit alpha [Clostridium folliculivorans]